MPRSRSPATRPAPAVNAMSGTISRTMFTNPAAVRPYPANPPPAETYDTLSPSAAKARV